MKHAKLVSHGSGAMLLLATLGSCGGGDSAPAPSAPKGAVTVALSVASVSPPRVDGSVSCIVDLAAAVTGTGSGTWIGASFRMYDAVTKSRLVASGEVPGSDLLSAFGTGSLIAGHSQLSRWQFTGAAAFAADVEMQYEPSVGATIRSATTRFDCVPSFSVGTAPPAIGEVLVAPSQGTLEAGAPLMVTYSAALPAGAVRTSVHVAGPCVVDRVFDEHADTTLSRTIAIPLPYPCLLGTPIGVNVVVFDVLGRGAAQYLATAVTMQDTVPPSAFLYLTHAIPGRTTAPEYSEYSLGDTLILQLGMNDNYRVSTLVWEITPVGVKDSIVSKESPLTNDGTGEGAQLWVGIRPEWAGKSLQIRVQARDAGGRLSPVITTPQDSIRVASAPAAP